MRNSHGESTPLLASVRNSDGSIKCYESDQESQPEDEDVVISKTRKNDKKYLT